MKNQQNTVLIVDDDPQIRDVLSIALEGDGFKTLTASNGADALRLFQNTSADLIILDISMPHMDGFTAIKSLREKSDVPVLFLSARDDEIDKVLGLELGGDDYVTKPFSPRELIARIRAILKRGQSAKSPTVLKHGALALNPDAMECSFNGKTLKLTRSEFRILERLISLKGAVLEKPRIFDLLYNGNPNASDRTVDSHIRNLRAKLDAVGGAGVIETLHGIGIRLGPCDA